MPWRRRFTCRQLALRLHRALRPRPLAATHSITCPNQPGKNVDARALTYTVYDKVYRIDVLQYAYACCKANQGAAGVDEERFGDIEAYGVDRRPDPRSARS